jgi:short-subunit dehydrogenase
MSKTILMAGAASGLGHGTVMGMAKNGHNVIATVENWPQVTQLRSDAEALGLSKKITVEKMDYYNMDDINHIVKKYADNVDVFAPNAATGETGPVAEIDVDRIRHVFEVNVFQTIELVQRFIKVFVARGHGKVIVTSSTAGIFTFDFLAPYCASKFALEGLLQTMYQELKGTGVQLSTINPGPFRTGFNDRMYDTLDQWYDPKLNFTPEQAVRDVQDLFAGDELQLDPQAMIDFMIDLIPKDEHPFRNVYPANFREEVMKYQESIWDWQTSPEQAKTKKSL